MPDRPRGKFGLPRLTDMGPNVSYHNTPASDCTIKHCYDGNTKKEMVITVRDAFLKHKDKFLSDMKEIGIPARFIYIGGSFVEGDFGCRSLEKGLMEFFNTPPANRSSELKQLIKDVQINTNTTSEAIETFKNEIPSITPPQDESSEWNKIVLEDMYVAFCSDVDVFVAIEDFSTKQLNRLFDNPDFLEVRSEFMENINTDIPGNTFAIVNMKNISQVTEPVLITENDFNKLLNKYY